MLDYIVVIAFFFAQALAAPSTNATCVTEVWTTNSRGQNPCEVAAYLGAPCTTSNTFRIPALEEGASYFFNESDANICLCNSVVWNLLSACALCQRGAATTWTDWSGPCADNLIAIGKYPISLPAGVAVPSWAYYDFTSSNTFNSFIASQQSGLESSAVSAPTSAPGSIPNPTVASSATSTSTSTSTGTGDSTSTASPVKIQSGSSSNTGAIVGGVVGGVLGIALIGLIAFILVRRRKSEDLSINGPQHSYQPPASTAEYKPYNSNHPSALGTPAAGQNVESLSYPYYPQGTAGQAPYPTATQP